MTVVDIQITRRVVAGPSPDSLAPLSPEHGDVVIVDDVETLAAGTVPGCNDDNPYR